MGDHDRFRFSISVRTDDEAVLQCLRALSQFAQQTGNKRIPWGGTKKSDWLDGGRIATFRFTAERYRQDFVGEVERLLPSDLWQIVATSDDDPASPQA